MMAFRAFSAAMSRIGKPISRLEDITRYLQPDGPEPRSTTLRPSRNICPAEEQLRPVYAGEPVAVEDDQLVFDAVPRVTRTLDFAPDRLGYLVNSEGLVLMSRSDDMADDSSGLRLTPIRLEDGPIMPARGTSAIRYKANLPKEPVANALDARMADAEPDVLAQHALAGGDVGIFDMRGREIAIRFKWAMLAAGRWRLLFRVAGQALTMQAAGRGWREAENDLAFDARGRLTEPAMLTLDLGRGLDSINLEFGRCGLTQFPDSTGLVKILACAQNGWPRAALREVAVREDGRVLGGFDNGRVDLLGLAAFADSVKTQHDVRQAA
jgi:flagellar hook protein FlgE